MILWIPQTELEVGILKTKILDMGDMVNSIVEFCVYEPVVLANCTFLFVQGMSKLVENLFGGKKGPSYSKPKKYITASEKYQTKGERKTLLAE